MKTSSLNKTHNGLIVWKEKRNDFKLKENVCVIFWNDCYLLVTCAPDTNALMHCTVRKRLQWAYVWTISVNQNAQDFDGGCKDSSGICCIGTHLLITFDPNLSAFIPGFSRSNTARLVEKRTVNETSRRVQSSISWQSI